MAKKPTTQYFTNVPDPSTPEGQAYAAGKALLTGITTGSPEVQTLAKKARETASTVDQARKDSTRISPAYWVTQTDFQDTFGRRYNPMNPQDQRDFFSLVQNAPGATRRTDVAGADVGAVIASRQRPESLPTYQDIGGVKVPENAFGISREEQKKAREEGYSSTEEKKQTEQRFKDARAEVKDRELTRRGMSAALVGGISKPWEQAQPSKPSKKEELPYSEREGGSLEDPKDILKYIQQYAPETLTPEQKAALGMQRELSAEPYAARAGIEAKKPKVPAPPYLLRKPTESKNPPYLLARPKDMTASKLELDKMKRDASNAPAVDNKLQTSANFPETVPADWWKQSVTGRPPGIPVPPSAEEMMYGGLAGGIAGRKKYSTIAPVPEPAPAPEPEPEPAPAPEPAPLPRIPSQGEEESDSTEGFGPGRRRPSALEQGMRAVQAGQQFGQNLVGAAVGQGKKAMDKVSSIAKAMVDKQRRAGMAQAIGVGQPHGGESIGQQELLRLWSLQNPGKKGVTVGELEEFGKTIYTPTEADVEEFGQGMEVVPTDFNINAPSAVTQQIMRQMGGRGAPSPLATPTGTKPLTRGRFEFDSELPAAVKSSIDRMSAMPQVQTTQPLTKVSEKAKTQEKRKTLSFTEGMSDAEVSAEYEKIFGREGKNLPIEVKKDMIERYRLGEMAESGAIFGGDPMYEMEIDPNTGELKLNPKTKK